MPELPRPTLLRRLDLLRMGMADTHTRDLNRAEIMAKGPHAGAFAIPRLQARIAAAAAPATKDADD